jgi:uncharacterized membrane protein
VIIRGPLAWVLAAALLVSLALNVLVAGVVLGRLRGPPPGDDFGHVVAMIARPYPPEIQHEIMEEAHDNQGGLREKFDALRDARRAVFEAMRTEPFDPAKLDAAYANARSTADTMQVAIQGIEAGAIAKAPADVRQRIRPPHGAFP